jgi:GntR family transcriptional regulator
LRQATNKLVHEGLLLRKKGVGTVVSKPVDSKAKNWMSFSQEMKSKGIEIKNYSTDLSWEVPPVEVLKFFGIDKKVKMLKMERVRGDKKNQFVYFISYFNPKIGLTGEEDFNRPLYEILERDFSVIAKVSKEEITAVAADATLAEHLHIKKGDPILKRKRFVYDPGRRPIEYNVGYYKSDSIVYTVESERD